MHLGEVCHVHSTNLGNKNLTTLGQVNVRKHEPHSLRTLGSHNTLQAGTGCSDNPNRKGT